MLGRKQPEWAARAARELEKAQQEEARRQRKIQARSESYRRQVQAHGPKFTVNLQAHERAIMTYLQKCWGFESRADTVRACLAVVAVLTRRGVQRLDLVVDPREDEDVLTR
jgi:hypothetical protein